jgi:hypothetical protein
MLGKCCEGATIVATRQPSITDPYRAAGPRSRDAMRPSFAATHCPSKNRGRRESWVRAAPAVSCAKMHERKRTRAYRFSGGIRPSLRNGFTAYSALSPATNSCCHRRPRIDDFTHPGWARKTSADLTSATDARTTRLHRTQRPPPSAPAGTCRLPKFWRRR